MISERLLNPVTVRRCARRWRSSWVGRIFTWFGSCPLPAFPFVVACSVILKPLSSSRITLQKKSVYDLYIIVKGDFWLPEWTGQLPWAYLLPQQHYNHRTLPAHQQTHQWQT